MGNTPGTWHIPTLLAVYAVPLNVLLECLCAFVYMCDRFSLFHEFLSYFKTEIKSYEGSL